MVRIEPERAVYIEATGILRTFLVFGFLIHPSHAERLLHCALRAKQDWVSFPFRSLRQNACSVTSRFQTNFPLSIHASRRLCHGDGE